MGIAELLESKVGEGFEHARHVQEMYQAAANIWDIVKKMGRVRTYATKPYIEGVDIIDFGAGEEG